MKFSLLLSLIISIFLLSSCSGDSFEDRFIAAIEDLDRQDTIASGNIEAILPSSCSVNQTVEGAVIQCQDGTSATISHGVDGQNGQDGQDGSSCSVFPVEGVGAMIECGVGDFLTTVLVHDGAQGVAGEDGAQGIAGVSALVEIINPCEDNGLDQVILKFGDGSLLTNLSSGKKSFLTLLLPGDYTTNDGDDCAFSVTSEGEVTW